MFSIQQRCRKRIEVVARHLEGNKVFDEFEENVTSKIHRWERGGVYSLLYQRPIHN